MTDLTTGLERYLEHLWGHSVAVTGLSMSSAGARRSNIAFDARPAASKVMDDGDAHRLVATLAPSASASNHGVEAEVAIRTLARERGVPTPLVVGWTNSSEWIGRPFFVSERIDGETVPRRVLRLVDQHGLGPKVAAQLGKAMALLHSIGPDEAPDSMADPGPGTPAEIELAALDRVISGLLEPRPTLRFGMRWLEQHLPPAPRRESVTHGDIRNGNLIVADDGLRGVLDWEGARRRGDPMGDAAWPALRMWRFHHDDREIGGFAERGPFVEAYVAAGGAFDEQRFEWWKVSGTVRWGLGLAGQAAGYLSGSERSIVMAASGHRLPEVEWDLLMLTRPG